MNQKQWRCTLWTVSGVVAVAVAGSLFTDTASDWYRGLTLPVFQPPAWVFGVVWTLLYALMAAALSLALCGKGKGEREGEGCADERCASCARRVLPLAIVAGVLNVAWTFVFFRLHAPAAALGVLAVLFVTSIALTRQLAKCSTAAAWLMLPTLAWLGYALALNYGIVTLN